MPIKTPNMHMLNLDADLSKRKKDTVTPFMLLNLSTTENLRLKKDTVVAFAEKDETEGKVFHIDTINTTPRQLGSPTNSASIHPDCFNRYRVRNTNG